jgi:hypothetical protein
VAQLPLAVRGAGRARAARGSQAGPPTLSVGVRAPCGNGRPGPGRRYIEVAGPSLAACQWRPFRRTVLGAQPEGGLSAHHDGRTTPPWACVTALHVTRRLSGGPGSESP